MRQTESARSISFFIVLASTCNSFMMKKMLLVQELIENTRVLIIDENVLKNDNLDNKCSIIKHV